MKGSLKKISISGFKSIRELKALELRDLNVIIGANGAGKSNFIQVFRMLEAMATKQFQKFIGVSGGAPSFLYNGPKTTTQIKAEFEFESGSSYSRGPNFYRFEFDLTADETFLVGEEREYVTTSPRSYGSPSTESRLRDFKDETSSMGESNGVGYYVYKSISNWIVYHFHDTSAQSPMRLSEIVEDSQRLKKDGANVAPVLLHLKNGNTYEKQCYREIVNAIRLVMPFFDDFRLDIRKEGEAEKVRLSWQQKGSDYPMQPYHLSDGSIRFICLATALLQPNLPSTIVIDEPELGLHPEAIAVLAELIHDASKRTQIVVATQSPTLINHFSIEDILVVNRKDGQSTFERLERDQFACWLEDYSVGDLWTKNVIQGGTNHE
jgi:predicted ATPase